MENDSYITTARFVVASLCRLANDLLNSSHCPHDSDPSGRHRGNTWPPQRRPLCQRKGVNSAASSEPHSDPKPETQGVGRAGATAARACRTHQRAVTA